MARFIKTKKRRDFEITGVKTPRKLTERPQSPYFHSLMNKVVTLNFPQDGSFNAGLVKFPGKEEYICVYRPSEHRFIASILNKNLSIKPNSYFKFDIGNCADPRLIWTADNRLLMIYSSTSEVGFHRECIRGMVIMDLNKSSEFLNNKPFLVSPPDLEGRQKNWMPFSYDGKIYLIASICPHIIYELDDKTFKSKKLYETSWLNPWMFKEFLRGNTNAVQLEDGNYLGTFHTATWHEKTCYYDNGCYLFEGKPPFKVLKCSNRTYLKAEDAIHPHFRKGSIIRCPFPVGMVRNNNQILISYGDNDSIVKIMETTVQDMMNLMLDVY